MDKYGSENSGQLVLDATKLGHIEIDGGIKYKAQELHFNGPSEHKINGTRYDMEMQIIHEIDTESQTVTPDRIHYAIIAVLFKKNQDKGHEFLDAISHPDKEL